MRSSLFWIFIKSIIQQKQGFEKSGERKNSAPGKTARRGLCAARGPASGQGRLKRKPAGDRAGGARDRAEGAEAGKKEQRTGELRCLKNWGFSFLRERGIINKTSLTDGSQKTKTQKPPGGYACTAGWKRLCLQRLRLRFRCFAFRSHLFCNTATCGHAKGVAAAQAVWQCTIRGLSSVG